MREHGWTLTRAVEHAGARRWIRPNAGFMQQLQMYEKVLERRREGHGDAGREEGYREDARDLDESGGAAVTTVT